MRLDFNTADFTFSTSAFPSPMLRVLHFKGREEVSRLFELEVVLVSEIAYLELDAFIGQPALLSIRGLTGTRYVHGVIEQFQLLTVGRQLTHYRAVLVPTLSPLRYRHNARIFQQMSVPDIVLQVIRDAGLPTDLVQVALEGEYGPRDYCVQYQETDLAFISRLLEEEGIFFFFEHAPDRDVLVLADDLEATEPLPTSPVVPFRDESRATALEEEHLYQFQAGSSVRSGRVTLRDYRFVQPGLDLTASQSAASHEELEVYYYPGEYVEPTTGQQLSGVRLQELQAQRYQLWGSGTCRALEPGFRFSLMLHPRPDFNQEYFILRVDHEASQPGVLGEEAGAGQVQDTRYAGRVVCMPSSVPFRPPRLTPRPVIPGVQSAVVVGPKGEEIYCDEYGRVKVQFHWDREGQRNDQSSCWIRVSQPWGGVAYGGMFLPRVGQEVLVQFLEGDPDRPVIVGRVYNADNPVPYPLPKDKTVSTLRTQSSPGGGGFNELRFEDRKGAEEVFLHAQKDLNEVVRNHHHKQVGGHSETIVRRHIRVRSTTDAIYLSAPRKIVLTVGKSRITLTPDKITLKSPNIWSEAEGTHVVLGGVVKINCDESPPEEEGEEGSVHGVAMKAANAAVSGGAESKSLVSKVLPKLAPLAEKMDISKVIDKLPGSKTFKDYLKTAVIPGFDQFKTTLATALREGRLPTVDELKDVGISALSNGVGAVLGKAVQENLPEDWPDNAKKALADLVRSSSQSAIETAIREPDKMDEWLSQFGDDAVKAIATALGELAKQQVAKELEEGKSQDPGWIEEQLIKYLPDGVRLVIVEGIPVIFDRVK